MTLNIGPQHPATHGTLRIVARLDGEQVVAAEPIMGYMHRGYEKLTEVRTYPQITTLVNRIDWLGSFANEVPFILAAERLMGVEAPPRATWIRTMLFEMARIANVGLFLGDMGLQVGAVTPGVLRLPRPRVRAQPDRGGHRRSVPPELRPHRRPQGRPAQGLDRRDQGRHGHACATSATRWRSSSWAPRSSRRAAAASASSRPTSPCSTACRAPTSAPRASTGTSAATPTIGLLAYDDLDWKVWTHPDGD